MHVREHVLDYHLDDESASDGKFEVTVPSLCSTLLLPSLLPTSSKIFPVTCQQFKFPDHPEIVVEIILIGISTFTDTSLSTYSIQTTTSSCSALALASQPAPTAEAPQPAPSHSQLSPTALSQSSQWTRLSPPRPSSPPATSKSSPFTMTLTSKPTTTPSNPFVALATAVSISTP